MEEGWPFPAVPGLYKVFVGNGGFIEEIDDDEDEEVDA